MIKVERLCKEFEIGKKGQKFTAVNDITFDVADGEKVAFIGPNGAGKSTTIKMMTGIIRATSGSISVNGYNPVKDKKEMDHVIGCLFGQKSSLWMHLPAMDTFKLLGSIYDMPASKALERINYLIELFDIKDIVGVPVKKLSLGQRMKCEIVASIIHNPNVLFLDEPTIGLDIVSKDRIRSIIDELNASENTTIFLTSHDIEDVEKVCDRIIIIDHGRVIIDSTISQLKNRYASEKVIEVVYKSLRKGSNFEGLNVVASEGKKVSVKVKSTEENVGNVLARLSVYGEIKDIKINEKSLEEIISSIYVKGGNYA